MYLGRKVNAIGRSTEADTERRVGIACDLCEEHLCTPESSATRRKLETQMSLTNRATHLCKCNDVADLTIVIKIRLKKKSIPRIRLSRSFKVIGTDTNRPDIYDFLLVFSRNFVPKTHGFRDIRVQKCCDLEIRVKVIGYVTIC